MWGKDDGKSQGLFGGRETWGPLVLMSLCTPAALVIVHTMTNHSGSFPLFAANVMADPLGELAKVWVYPSKEAMQTLAAFAAFELFLMRALPGRKYTGPVTAKGHVPEYVMNAPLAFATTLGTFILGSKQFGWLKLWDMGRIFQASEQKTVIFHEMISFMVVFSLFFCLGLYLKGIYAPSSPEHSSSGNWVVDYYWGTELYPRVLGFDVKVFTNCRFGMMAWALIVLAAAAESANQHGGIPTNASWLCAALQLVYIAKFFWWEDGYMSSMDIMHDRAGYYICWGCLVWVPSFYTISAQYWLKNGSDAASVLTCNVTWALFAVGVLFIFLNYEADRQRMFARRTGGKALLWGTPMKLVEAQYTTSDGQTRQSLLLASHLWGYARHLHYVFELLAALSWAVPVTVASAAPYAYFIFLNFLLFDRAVRDDHRCAAKYGKFWDLYCGQVPYKVVPGVF